MKIFIAIFLIIFFLALVGPIMSRVENPDYKVVRSEGNIEIRDYPRMIVAQVEVFGERKDAIRSGFRILADYIFGNNTSRVKMEMTAPVLQEQDGEKWKVRFVMPIPNVTQNLNFRPSQSPGVGRSELARISNTGVALIDPTAGTFASVQNQILSDVGYKTYTLATLPKPNSKEINLIELPVRRFVVIRFSGLANDQNIEEYKKQLQAYISAQGLKPVGEPVLAFYNPPWTLPFLRRNEVMRQLTEVE